MTDKPIRPVIIPDTRQTSITEFHLDSEGNCWHMVVPVLAWKIEQIYDGGRDEWTPIVTPISLEELSDEWCINGPQMDGDVFLSDCTCDSLQAATEPAKELLLKAQEARRARAQKQKAG